MQRFSAMSTIKGKETKILQGQKWSLSQAHLWTLFDLPCANLGIESANCFREKTRN